MTKRCFPVLMAEDNRHDIIATQRAWEKSNITNPLHIVRDGEECLDYLHRRGVYEGDGSALRPGILLLDIKMPKMDGLGVLEYIRESDQFGALPVVILTTSKADEDRVNSYNLGVNAYIQKPVGLLNLTEVLKRINLFWQIVELPEWDNGDIR